jgi:hypothetical protein
MIASQRALQQFVKGAIEVEHEAEIVDPADVEGRRPVL